MREKAIAEENADGIAPFSVGRGLVAPPVGSVDDVVVDERGHVDEFQNDGEIDVGGGDFSRGSTGQNGKGGAEVFAAVVESIGDVTLDGWVKGFGLFPDALIDRVEVRIDQLEGLLEAGARGGGDAGAWSCEIFHKFDLGLIEGKVNGGLAGWKESLSSISAKAKF